MKDILQDNWLVSSKSQCQEGKRKKMEFMFRKGPKKHNDKCNA